MHTLPLIDGISKGLKIKKKACLVLYDTSKTAVVDCVQDFDSEYYESTQSET